MSHSRVLPTLVIYFSALFWIAAADTNFFPIMAWNSVPNDPAVLKKMHEAGLTVAGFVAPGALDACQAAGLKAIVSDTRCAGYDWQTLDENKARTNLSSLVSEVGRHPAVYGYYLRDEPSAGMFPALSKAADILRPLSPGKWPYINLFPDYAENWQLGTTNYSEYLERFIATCHPSIISYDNYALMDDGSLRQNYWSNLEAVRAACKQHQLEFWNIVLSVAHYNYREPTAADFRFQAYTTLAYGGRGLSYFTYFAVPYANYRMAPIDQFGNETATWKFMQNANLQILKIAPAYLQLTSDDAYHIGAIPAGNHGPSTNNLIASVSGDNFLVGDFTHRDGSRYAVIVNKDLAHSRPASPQFRKPPRRVQFVSPYSGELLPFEGDYTWLAPGQGVLIKIEQ